MGWHVCPECGQKENSNFRYCSECRAKYNYEWYEANRIARGGRMGNGVAHLPQTDIFSTRWALCNNYWARGYNVLEDASPVCWHCAKMLAKEVGIDLKAEAEP